MRASRPRSRLQQTPALWFEEGGRVGPVGRYDRLGWSARAGGDGHCTAETRQGRLAASGNEAAGQREISRRFRRTPRQASLRERRPVFVSPTWRSPAKATAIGAAAATLDVIPGGDEPFDLRLPKGCELIQASVEDWPIVPKRIGDAAWRFAAVPSESPRRIGVIYHGVTIVTRGSGKNCGSNRRRLAICRCGRRYGRCSCRRR